MSRGKVCSICASPDRGQIDALMASGIRLKEIAAQIPGISPFALSRHKRNCLTPAPAPPTGNSVDAESQLALWIQRADDLYNASGAALDLRGQSAAIAAAFRAMEFQLKHQERLHEQAVRDLPRDSRLWTEDEAAKFLDWMDSIVRAADEKMNQRVV